MKTVTLILALCLSATFIHAGIINIAADDPTIQRGIDAAAYGDTVLMADSTYYENIRYRGKTITVASHFLIDNDTAHVSATIIDGSKPANVDSASVVYFVSGEDSTSVLYGFTITGGSGTITIYPYPIRIGGGIACEGSGAKTIHNYIMILPR